MEISASVVNELPPNNHSDESTGMKTWSRSGRKLAFVIKAVSSGVGQTGFQFLALTLAG